MDKSQTQECVLVGTEWVPLRQIEAIEEAYNAILKVQAVLSIRGIVRMDESNKFLAPIVNFLRK